MSNTRSVLSSFLIGFLLLICLLPVAIAQGYVLQSVTGSSNNPANFRPPGAPPVTWSLPISDSSGNVSPYQGNWTVTFVWNGGSSNVPPPTTSYWKESIDAYVSGTGTGASISTDPSFALQNDFYPVSPGSSTMAGELITEGSQLSQKGGTSVTFDPYCTGIAPNSGGGTLFWYTVAPDSRGILLTNGATTYTKGPSGLPVANSLYANPSEIDSLETIPTNFVVNEEALGGWNANSTAVISGALSGPVTFGPTTGTQTVNADAITLSTWQKTPYMTSVNGSITDGKDGAVAIGTANIILHAPLENPQLTGTLPLPPQQWGGGATSFPAGVDGLVTENPPTINWSVLAQTGSGLITTGGAVYVALAAEPPVWVVGAIAAAGWALTQVGPPQPVQGTIGGSGSQSHFQQDVSDELVIANGDPSGAVFADSVPRMNAGLAKAVSRSGNYSGYWSGSTYTEGVWRKETESIITGDGYGASGYTGQVNSTVTGAQGAVIGVDTWTYNGTLPQQ